MGWSRRWSPSIAFDELAAGDARTTMLAAIVATVLLSVVAHAVTARPLAGRFAAYVQRTRGPADDRPSPALAARPRLRRQRPSAEPFHPDSGDTDSPTRHVP